MRRAVAIVLCLLVIFSLAAAAQAASRASKIVVSAAVSGDGTCQVAVDIHLVLETAIDSLDFPIPKNARNVTVNGSSARTSRSADVLNVDLSRLVRNVTGAFSLRLQYTLPDLVAFDELEKLQLTLPLLSGFSYPVDAMEFTVNLPGEILHKPVFSSSYFQQSIEESLTYSVSGMSVSGSIQEQLKDLESLTMTLEVPQEQFPQEVTAQWTVDLPDIAMIVLAVLAALYWLIFLRCAPFLRKRSAQPPAGCTAGELSCVVTGQGSDLTMMVLSWAQLGYILVHLGDSGRVTLHKRMDMGNERSAYEVRIFRSLFGKRQSIDGTGYHYASLCRKIAVTPGDVRDLFRKGSGNPKLFRVLCAGIGFFGGIRLGIALAGNALLGILLIALLAVFGAVSAWFIQEWARGLHLRNPLALVTGLGLCLLWLLIGMMAELLNVAACVAGAQLLCSLAWVYGSRRTQTGRNSVAQVLGLRSYLKHLSAQDMKRISKIDPDYFFTMAPYALALGVQKHYAQAFGKKRLNGCPYLTTGMDAHMSAAEWMHVMQRTVDSLDFRQKRLPLERLMGR